MLPDKSCCELTRVLSQSPCIRLFSFDEPLLSGLVSGLVRFMSVERSGVTPSRFGLTFKTGGRSWSLNSGVFSWIVSSWGSSGEATFLSGKLSITGFETVSLKLISRYCPSPSVALTTIGNVPSSLLLPLIRLLLLSSRPSGKPVAE